MFSTRNPEEVITKNINEILQKADTSIKLHCRKIMIKLRDDYLELRKTNFEEFIKADWLFSKINIALQLMKQRFSPDNIEKMQEFFIDRCYFYYKNQGFTNANNAVSEAELDLFLHLKASELNTDNVQFIKLKIKQKPNWSVFPAEWEDTLTTYKQFLQLSLAEQKGKAINKLDFEIDSEESEEIRSLELGAILALDLAKDVSEIQMILTELSNQKAPYFRLGNYLKALGIFPSTPTQEKMQPMLRNAKSRVT